MKGLPEAPDAGIDLTTPKAPAPAPKDKLIPTDTPGVYRNPTTGKSETARRWNPWTGRWE